MWDASPGWYPDPEGRSGLRWWDGERWTSGTRPVSRSSRFGRRREIARLRDELAETEQLAGTVIALRARLAEVRALCESEGGVLAAKVLGVLS